MKNKKKNDPFETQSWGFDAITNPHQVFAACFNFAEISAFRSTIRQVLFSAKSNKVYSRDDPSFMLLKFRAIISAMLAALRLCKQQQTGCLKIAYDQFMDKRLYARPHSTCPEWEYLPRELSEAEYKNPYLVFKRFFKYQKIEKWQQDIEEILDCALASCTDDCDLDLLKMYLYLTKLMEAAHLIDVREVTHINGYLKPGILLQNKC